MTDLDVVTDTTLCNSDADGTNSAVLMLKPSQGMEQDHTNSNNQEIGSTQEPSRICLQEVISGQDAELTTMDVQSKQSKEQLGTETGSAEIHNHRGEGEGVGYKREHSPEQSSQTLPGHVPITCTCTCTAACCLVEPQQELVSDGDTLQRQEVRHPRKRVKLAIMEGGTGDGCK